MSADKQCASASSESLSEICAGIALQIDIAKQAKEVWEYISDQAEAINAAKYGVFFGVAQRAALHEILLAICRVFDDNPRVISFKTAINRFSATEDVRPAKLRQRLIDFNANSTKLASLSDEKLLPFAVTHMHQQLPKKDQNAHLDGILKLRNEYIAHNALTKTQFAINEREIEYCLDWADRFITLTRDSFGNARRAFARLVSENVPRKALR
jgi:hypothetical protein